MKKILNFSLYAILLYILITKIPGIYKNYKLQNTTTVPSSLKRLSGEEITFPIPDQKVIVVFWATWCGPCKIELNRLNLLVGKNVIKSNELIAINIQESAETVNQFLSENPLQFLIALDQTGKIAETYNVSGTPTVIFFDNMKIEWMTTGLSPTLEYRVSQFLKN